MVWRASRLALYVLIVRRDLSYCRTTSLAHILCLTQWIFSVILIGFTSSRIHFTHATAHFYGMRKGLIMPRLFLTPHQNLLRPKSSPLVSLR